MGLKRIYAIFTMTVIAITISGCDSEPGPEGQPPAVPPDVIATYRGGEIETADLEKYLLSQPVEQRFPPAGKDQLKWLEGQVGQLFLRRLLVTPERIGQLTSDPGFQRTIEERLPQDLASAYSPDQAAQMKEHMTRRAAWETIRQQALLDYIESLPDKELEEFFAGNQHLFLTDAQVGLTMYSWHIGSADPMRYLSGPMRFAEALRSGRPESGQIWDRESQRARVDREILPLVGLSTLEAQRPDVAMLNLSSDARAGDVVGPYRHEQQLLVVKIDNFVPRQQLTFAEARPQIPEEFLRRDNRRLFTRWQEKWVADYDLRVFSTHLTSIDLTLLASPPGPEPADRPTDQPQDG